MSDVLSRIWKPVKRRGAERYLQLTVLSFAASVSLTRLILELTGYPQLGTVTLHIAHVLYGGVLLYAASLLPLLYANRWSYTWSAILSGVGVGLFIDEVGKFITQANDYFFPPAAPIIYAFFLLTVLLYLRTCSNKPVDTRSQLYTVLEILQEVLDHTLEQDENEEMKTRLETIKAESNNPHYKQLATELIDFVTSGALKIVPDEQNIFDKIIQHWNKIEEKYLTDNRFRAFLVISLIVLGVPQFQLLYRFTTVAGDAALRDQFLATIAQDIPNITTNIHLWAFTLLVGEGLTGLLMLIGAALIIIDGRNWGIRAASVGLIVSLVAVNLVAFYIEQFSTIITAVYEFILLQALFYYERKYGEKPLAAC